MSASFRSQIPRGRRGWGFREWQWGSEHTPRDKDILPKRRDSAIEDRKKVAGREQKAVALAKEAIVLIKPVHHHALPTLLNRVKKAADMAHVEGTRKGFNVEASSSPLRVVLYEEGAWGRMNC
jgi:hypothetical protein